MPELYCGEMMFWVNKKGERISPLPFPTTGGRLFFDAFWSETSVERFGVGEGCSAASASAFVADLIAFREVFGFPDAVECPLDDANWGGVGLVSAFLGQGDLAGGWVELAEVGVVAGVVGSGEEFYKPGFGVVVFGGCSVDAVGVVVAFAVIDGENCFACGEELWFEHLSLLWCCGLAQSYVAAVVLGLIP